jgi:two-component system, chemotaxis family, sensor kinase CheA
VAAENNTIQARVESIAAAIVLVEPSDLQALAELHTGFEEISQLAGNGVFPQVVVDASKAAMVMIEKIIMGDASDGSAVLRVVAETIGRLQEVIRDGRPVEQVSFPAELSLDRPFSTDTPAPLDIPGGVCHPSNLPWNVDEKLFGEFLTRQAAAMEEMEQMILSLEKTSDEDSLRALKRLIHTLKGEAAFMGLEDVERLCHITEDALGNRAAGEMVDGLLHIKDWLNQVFQSCAGKGPMPESVEQAIGSLQTPKASNPAPEAPAATIPTPPAGPTASADSPVAAPPVSASGDRALLEDFVCEANEHLEAADVHLLALEVNPQDKEAINAVFRAFHTIKGIAGCLGMDQIRSLAHEAENLLDRARKGELVLSGAPVDVSFDAIDGIRRMVKALREFLSCGTPIPVDEAANQLKARIVAVVANPTAAVPGGAGRRNVPPPAENQVAEPAESRKLGEILVQRGTATPEVIEQGLDQQARDQQHPPLGEVLVHEGKVPAKEVAQALRTQNNESVQVREIVKIDAERLDRLLDTIGELVIAESMVSQSGALRQAASPELLRQLGQLDKITRELQETGTGLRMVPIRATFQKMARMVRDLARKVGKPVDFATSGEETELDKNVVDRIGDPLVHMVRNAVDHGLEANAELRRQAGKSPTGRIELRAFHKGGNIHVEISDDGRGLDRQAILAKAVERGLVAPDAKLTDSEVWNLVFEPGLSTAKVVTDVSGRGVGMDVVRRNIEQLRGQIEIQSTVGKGTTFSIRLPLTLAIIDGMVIRVGQQRYVIPTLSVIRSVRPAPEDLSTVLGRGEMLSLQGKLIPLFRLSQLFDVEGAEQDPTHAIVVIVEDEGRQIGLLTDDLLGQQQIVIKSLGESMQGIPGLSGGAVMPDGHVGLILDVSGLAKLAHT